jgi:hypothetical protein
MAYLLDYSLFPYSNNLYYNQAWRKEMKRKEKVIEKIKEEGKILAFSPVLENLIRIGYGARGLIYGTIGVLAIMVALGVSGSLQDQQGAIASIGQQPIGRILLGIVLVGLVGYSLWGLIRAFFDPLHKGKDFKGILERIGFFISAVAYAILIPPTYNLIFGMPNAAQNGAQGIQIRNIISTVFLAPFGKWIVGIIGLIILGIGVFQVYKGLHHNFAKQFNPYALTSKQAGVVKIIGRVGTLGRAAVFALVGIFLLFAAYHANPAEVKGIDGALLILMHEPYGAWLLGIVAVGLIAFGCYSLLGGFWFKFKR